MSEEKIVCKDVSEYLLILKKYARTFKKSEASIEDDIRNLRLGIRFKNKHQDIWITLPISQLQKESRANPEGRAQWVKLANTTSEGKEAFLGALFV